MNTPTFISETLKEKLSTYCKRMEEITSYNPMKRDRHRVYVTIRAMVAYKLLQDGFMETHVGVAMDLEHSTIHYYRNKVQAYLSLKMYEAEQMIWNKFIHYEQEEGNS